MKKLYIVVNNKVADKGKLARACATIGAMNPYETINLSTIVVKGGDNFDDLLRFSKNMNILSGFHIDAGHTQVKAGTILSFGVMSGSQLDQELQELKLL